VRTRKVIGIPTAVRYADLCAYRSKNHIDAYRTKEGITETSFKADPTKPEEYEKKKREVLELLSSWIKLGTETLKSPYYC